MPPGSSERSDLAARYRGARVQVVNGGNGNFDLMGRLLKVAVGDWFITDNAAIANTFQAHKFEVLRYVDASDVASLSKATGVVIDLAGGNGSDEGKGEWQARDAEEDRGMILQKGIGRRCRTCFRFGTSRAGPGRSRLRGPAQPHGRHGSIKKGRVGSMDAGWPSRRSRA